MGIPKLMHHLLPYSEEVIFSRRHAREGPEQPSCKLAVIDGPSLAYHIYNLCHSRTSVGAPNALVAIPPYADLARTILLWLEELEKHNIEIQHIYFDGILPPSKRHVRLSRLQDSANQLVNFRATHRVEDASLSARTHSKPIDASSVMKGAMPRSSKINATFLVNVAIEALLASKYASITEVVGGEADAFCAEASRLNGSTVFTSDSDLVVHDLGPDGNVVLFRDIDSIHLSSRGRCIRAYAYYPRKIAQRLELCDLIGLAYLLERDSHISFTQACQTVRAQDQKKPVEGYESFYNLYTVLPAPSKFASEEPTMRSHLSRLDPRLSELVHQLKVNTNEPQRHLDMFLPFILDDPTKSSAWRAGEDVRQIGYSLLTLIDPTLHSIREYERKGTQIGHSVVSLDLSSNIIALMSSLDTKSRGSLERYTTLSRGTQWRAVATEMLLEWCQANDKPTIDHKWLPALIIRSENPVLVWSWVHAVAQQQAILYSLRIVRQTLVIVLSVESMQISDDILGCAKSLLDLLDSMPGLAIILSGYEDSDLTQDIGSILLGSSRPSEISADDSSIPSKKRKKKKRKGSAGGTAGQAAPLRRAMYNQSNPFDLLGE